MDLTQSCSMTYSAVCLTCLDSHFVSLQHYMQVVVQNSTRYISKYIGMYIGINGKTGILSSSVKSQFHKKNSIKIKSQSSSVRSRSSPRSERCFSPIHNGARLKCRQHIPWGTKARECVSTGAAGALTYSSLGHHFLHPLILRLLVLCAPAVLRPRALQDAPAPANPNS